MNIQEISARLAGLAVFRGLLDDPVLADYSALIGALARGAGRHFRRTQEGGQL